MATYSAIFFVILLILRIISLAVSNAAEYRPEGSKLSVAFNAVNTALTPSMNCPRRALIICAALFFPSLIASCITVTGLSIIPILILPKSIRNLKSQACCVLLFVSVTKEPVKLPLARRPLAGSPFLSNTMPSGGIANFLSVV